ncbi:hypothetical protein CLOM_g3184 [Closterium sp. NIES-68]|nr:hypothetical protein CLOM_g3184 [Closterium sp. NIES-68]
MSTPCCPTTPATSGGLITNRYRRIRLIGRGSQGNVWECEDVITSLRVACKSFPHAGESAFDARLGICAELCGLKMVSGHPNIVRLVEFAVDSSEVHIIMELAPGGDDLLSEVMRRGPLAEPLAANVFRQLASAVAFCHACGVMHRDVKPDNVLLVRVNGYSLHQRPPPGPPPLTLPSRDSGNLRNALLAQAAVQRPPSPPSPPPPLTLPSAPYPASVASSSCFDKSTVVSTGVGRTGIDTAVCCSQESSNGGDRVVNHEPLSKRDECGNSTITSNSTDSGNGSNSSSSSSDIQTPARRNIKSIFSRSFPASPDARTSLTLLPANLSDPPRNPASSSPMNFPSYSASASAPHSAPLTPASPVSPVSPDRGIVGVKLADFGASIVVKGGLSGRLKDRGAGTRGYKAPEMGGKRGYDMKADVYSMGVTLCAMLTGHIPDTPLVDFCSPIWKGVSADARDLVRRMLEDDPDLRLSSFEVLEHRWLNRSEVRNLDMATRCPSLLASLLPSPSPLSSPFPGAVAVATAAATAAAEEAASSRWVPRGSSSFSSISAGTVGLSARHRGISVTASCASISCA